MQVIINTKEEQIAYNNYIEKLICNSDINQFIEYYNNIYKHTDLHGNNILHMACLYNQVAKVIFLVNAKHFDYNAVNNSGMTPLDIALKNNHIECAHFIIKQMRYFTVIKRTSSVDTYIRQNEKLNNQLNDAKYNYAVLLEIFRKQETLIAVLKQNNVELIKMLHDKPLF